MGRLEMSPRENQVSLLQNSDNHNNIEDLIRSLRSKRVKTKWCTCSFGCCCRGFLYLFLSFTVIFFLIFIVEMRQDIFLHETSEDYYFDDYNNYIVFLNWGDSGTTHVFTNFTASAMKLAYGDEITSEEGWDNLCSYTSTLEFINGDYDIDHCSITDRDNYLQGCNPGFYQPFLSKANIPQVCPDGFFCPEDFACTMLCMPGTQCTKSSLKSKTGRCSFPNTMHDAKTIDPLLIEINDKETSNLTCPGAGNMFLCEGGYYCSTAITIESCSKGYYCPIGSVKEIKCSFLGNCPKGSKAPDYQEGVYFTCLAIIFGFIISLKIFRRIRRHLREKRIALRKSILKEKKLQKSQNHLKETGDITLHGSSNGGGGGASGGGLLGNDFDLLRKESLRSNDGDSESGSDGQQSPIASSPKAASSQKEFLSSFRDKSQTMLNLTFIKLGLELRSNNIKVLNGVTGSCRPGRVTAIMGPSGAGKTTLMNTLAGRATYGRTCGTLLINGSVDTIKSYSDLVGFVPQDDIMHSDLSVKENLLIYASLRLPYLKTRKEVMNVVLDVMNILELDRISHSIIGDAEKRGISGGQRKRVNIGMEMVADPSLLFLDEPTSGLDSTTSFAVIDALRAISRKGSNVIVVLHQPSYQIYEMFDDVIFLARGGSSVYVGQANGAMKYFNTIGFNCPPLVNPADFFMDVVAGKYPRVGDELFASEDLLGLWEEEEEKSNVTFSKNLYQLKPLTSSELAKVQTCGLFKSFLYFLSRAFTQQVRASSQMIYDLLLEAFAGTLVGCLYINVEFSDLTKFLTFSAMALGLTVSIASLRVFGDERVVFWRESAPGSGMNLDMFAYFMAKNIVELPRLGFLTFFFVLSFYPLVTPNIEWYFFFGYSCAASFACSGLAYFASIALSPLKAQLLVVIYVLVAVMFSGLATRLKQLSENTLFLSLTYLSYARWLSELCYLQQVYSSTIAWRMPPSYYLKPQSDSVLTGVIGLEYTPSNETMMLNSLMLICLGLLFRLLAFISLIIFNRDKRGLQTVTQLLLYFIINPIDDWYKERKELNRIKEKELLESNQLYNQIGSLVENENNNPFISSSVNFNSNESNNEEDDDYSAEV